MKRASFQHDAPSSAENPDQKYLARVTTMKDGQILANGLGGSTLPDAWAFAHRWNVERNKTLPALIRMITSPPVGAHRVGRLRAIRTAARVRKT